MSRKLGSLAGGLGLDLFLLLLELVVPLEGRLGERLGLEFGLCLPEMRLLWATSITQHVLGLDAELDQVAGHQGHVPIAQHRALRLPAVNRNII